MRRKPDFAKQFLLAIAVLANMSTIYAQTTAPSPNRPSFDVASIKLRKGEITQWSDPSVRGRSVRGTASTLLELITYAYGVRSDQISGGPGWAGSDRYDLDAKAEGEGILTTAQSRQMVQSLLEDRFQLKIRRETQEVPMYALVVGKSGPKFKASAADAPNLGGVRTSDKGLHMETTKGTMAQLASQLSVTAGRPVLDETNLAGYYAYTLDWFPASVIPPAELVDVPSMFTALQDQLGLKLESTKGPMEKLVIEHAERPSEN